MKHLFSVTGSASILFEQCLFPCCQHMSLRQEVLSLNFTDDSAEVQRGKGNCFRLCCCERGRASFSHNSIQVDSGTLRCVILKKEIKRKWRRGKADGIKETKAENNEECGLKIGIKSDMKREK